MRPFVTMEESTWTEPAIAGCRCVKCHDRKLSFRFPTVTDGDTARSVTVVVYNQRVLPYRFHDLCDAQRWAKKMIVVDDDPNAHVQWLMERVETESQDCNPVAPKWDSEL